MRLQKGLLRKLSVTHTLFVVLHSPSEGTHFEDVACLRVLRIEIG